MRNESLPYTIRSRSSIVDGLAWGFIAFSILSLILLVRLANWKLVTPGVRTEFEPISVTQGG